MKMQTKVIVLIGLGVFLANTSFAQITEEVTDAAATPTPHIVGQGLKSAPER